MTTTSRVTAQIVEPWRDRSINLKVEDLRLVEDSQWIPAIAADLVCTVEAAGYSFADVVAHLNPKWKDIELQLHESVAHTRPKTLGDLTAAWAGHELGELPIADVLDQQPPEPAPAANPGMSVELIPGFGGHAQALRFTRTSSSNTGQRAAIPVRLHAGRAYRVRLLVRVSSASTSLSVNLRSSPALTAGQVPLRTGAITAGVHEFDLSGSTPDDFATGANTAITLVLGTNYPIGDTLDVEVAEVIESPATVTFHRLTIDGLEPLDDSGAPAVVRDTRLWVRSTRADWRKRTVTLRCTGIDYRLVDDAHIPAASNSTESVAWDPLVEATEFPVTLGVVVKAVLARTRLRLADPAAPLTAAPIDDYSRLWASGPAAEYLRIVMKQAVGDWMLRSYRDGSIALDAEWAGTARPPLALDSATNITDAEFWASRDDVETARVTRSRGTMEALSSDGRFAELVMPYRSDVSWPIRVREETIDTGSAMYYNSGPTHDLYHAADYSDSPATITVLPSVDAELGQSATLTLGGLLFGEGSVTQIERRWPADTVRLTLKGIV